MPADDRRAALAARLLADTRLRAAAATFLDALRARDVPAAPIKGLVTSALFYDDPLERPFGDVDVLVRPRHLPAVAALARDRGFRIVRDSKQLLTLNVVVPCEGGGVPMDVRASVGPPLFAAATAGEMLARAPLVTDPRVVRAPFHLLGGHDHLLLLMLDAVFDKFALRSEIRKRELSAALRRWVPSPERFAEAARAAGLATVAWLALRWLEEETGDPAAAPILAALEPLPRFPRGVAVRLAGTLRRDPYGASARVGVRLLADRPARGVAALALGAVGSAGYWLRHGRRDPWDGVLARAR